MEASTKAVAVLAYSSADEHTLQLQEGDAVDLLYLQSRDEGGWCYCRSKRGEGWCPATYIRPVCHIPQQLQQQQQQQPQQLLHPCSPVATASAADPASAFFQSPPSTRTSAREGGAALQQQQPLSPGRELRTRQGVTYYHHHTASELASGSSSAVAAEQPAPLRQSAPHRSSTVVAVGSDLAQQLAALRLATDAQSSNCCSSADSPQPNQSPLPIVARLGAQGPEDVLRRGIAAVLCAGCTMQLKSALDKDYKERFVFLSADMNDLCWSKRADAAAEGKTKAAISQVSLL
jgi:Variant SH3 domain